MGFGRLSAAVDAEGQERVARFAHDAPVTGIHEQNATGKRRAAIIERPPGGRHAIDGSVTLRRVHIPDDVAITTGISPQMTVLGTGEYDPRNYRHGLRLGGQAAARPPAAARR